MRLVALSGMGHIGYSRLGIPGCQGKRTGSPAF